MEDFDSQDTSRERPMITGAHEVTTGNELQLRSAGEGEVGRGPLTPGVVR